MSVSRVLAALIKAAITSLIQLPALQSSWTELSSRQHRRYDTTAAAARDAGGDDAITLPCNRALAHFATAICQTASQAGAKARENYSDAETVDEAGLTEF